MASKIEQIDSVNTAPFQPHSPPSKEAARGIEKDMGRLQALVYELILGRAAYGATDEEICHALKLNPSTARPRRVELVERGKVYDSGLTRKTRSGRAATIWRAR